MGGQGPGHKSVRAIEARLKNIQKARAARRRAPLPWRSGVESRIIEQLVWQWWVDKGSGPSTPPAFATATARQASGEKSRQQWPAFAEATARRASGEGKKKQIPAAAGRPHTAPFVHVLLSQQTGRPVPFDCAQGKRNDNVKRVGDNLGSPRIVARAKGRPWAKYRVARLLGVSHTWVNKLVKRIEADPERMRRKMRAFAPASFEKLERAREETRRERERGLLRGPIRWRRVKVTLEGKKRKVVAVTRLRQGYGEASELRLYGGVPTLCKERKGWGTQPVRYAELPEWARGLPLGGGAGLAAHLLSGPFVPQGKQAGGRGPRPVPFAFRRRR